MTLGAAYTLLKTFYILGSIKTDLGLFSIAMLQLADK